MGRYEIVEWPPWPYGVVARGTPIHSVFDKHKDRHIFWHKDADECIAFVDRQKTLARTHKSSL